jgi:hypothetical protein
MSDVDDPAIYAAQPIYDWQQTETGKWVMEHSAFSPEWTIGLDQFGFGYQVYITANLSEEDTTYFLLKYNTVAE